ncbi:ABC transporter ATP-binding protein [Halomarina pelagica]|uniref:ABC transporter ATP-binding protein n=1 Tax=Halomarina pelagica TaxID=2961599 RepID=UPI0026E58055|nr:ABC transporter ATP-binding protein [Halomarina sp. BND7]
MAVETHREAAVESDEDDAGIVLDGLRKEYGELVAVDGLTLEVESGEFLVLLGPSGCGKSTTLRMIAGLETPTDGTIELGGEDVTRTLPQKRDLSMVFQSYALYPHKTVRENLAFPLGKMDLSAEERERKIADVADLLEIADLLEKKPGQLSGGQRQRVAVGRTIVREPTAFLMDEPLSNLDAKLRVQTRFEIRELQQRLGTTTVYVTHDQEEAMSVADRIAVMADGELQQVGTPKEVYERPVNEFVAGFIGNPPMNFFEIDADEGARAFPDDPVELGASVPAAAVTLGVRPEHVHLVSDRDGEGATEDRCEPFACTVEVIEPLGNAYELGLTRGGEPFVARLRELPASVAPGATVEVAFDAGELHAFDASGEAIR